jgi:wyosine [tRNA(Phe)-imidazoG37] synthetase (radical SAM superfamily)
LFWNNNGYVFCDLIIIKGIILNIWNKSFLRQRIELVNAWLERSILSDKSLKYQVVLGPVKSARFGNILEINNVNKKVCSYNCIYCPLGKADCCSITQDCFLTPYELHLLVRKKLEAIKQAGESIDYIVFSGNGEPTLDLGLSKEILLLREFGYKIAVFTNASLLWNYNVQENLMYADHVSIRIDTLNEETWQKMSRPHRRLNYELILDGIKSFTNKYHGTITTETTLVKNMNDNAKEIELLAGYLNSLKIKTAYFLKPKYPSISNYEVIPEINKLNALAAYISEKVNKSKILFGQKAEELTFTVDFENELLGLLSVQPVQMEALRNCIKEQSSLAKLSMMIKNKQIRVVEYKGEDIIIGNYATI